MRSGIVAFLLGVTALLQCRSLPAMDLTILLPVCLLPALVLPRLRVILLFAVGFLYALAHAHAALYHQLPLQLEGESLTVSGRVVSLPDPHPNRTRFNFAVTDWFAVTDRTRLPQLVRLSWYGDERPRAGEHWRLRVRLKRPHGFMNPAGFDYETWLLTQGIQATGYVRQSGVNQRLAAAEPGLLPWRARLREDIRAYLGDDRGSALVTALAIGDRSGLRPGDWQVLRNTGTSHLLAISGLHIGLVAALVFFPLRWLLSLWPPMTRRIPAQRLALCGSLLAALAYAALAGFAIPTQRALVMLLVVALALLARRRCHVIDGLLLALLAVLLLDPLSLLSAGLWLSFLAVAVIGWGMGWRPPQSGLWWRYGRVQWLVAVGLLPVLLFWFQQYPLFSAVANLIAVPWVSLAVVPVILLGMTAQLVLPLLAGPLLLLAEWLLLVLWQGLEWLGQQNHAVWHQSQPDWPLLAAGLVGVALLFLPRAVPARWLGLFWLLPLLLPYAPRPQAGAFRLTVLDVGQGLAAVVETAGHVLVYDTGARFSDSFNAGDAAVLPYLYKRGYSRIDMLLISHGDNDHIGGAHAVIGALPVTQARSSVPQALPVAAGYCRKGQHWQWDGVDFEILHPPNDRFVHSNNQSCVLRISAPGGRALLPGDIEADAERRLISDMPSRLAADVLIAPHHGSRSSSSARFIERVGPDYTVFSTGYRNRYQFPDSDIIRRYRSRQVTVFNTATDGAVVFEFGQNGIRFETMRQSRRKFWHHAQNPLDGQVNQEGD